MAESSPPLVSVVVVTLNGSELLRACLAALQRQTYRRRETIVVDNGSHEDIRGLVAREFPEARVVRLEQNLGFAGGNNRGIAAAQGAYIALLNNDALAEPEWLEALVRAAEEDPAVGAVGTVVLDGNQPGALDSMGVGVALDGMSRQAFKGCPPPTLAAPQEILLPSGCACLYRARALAETGLFDERFFAYCEDTDLGLRLRRAGWKAVVAPGATVTHYYSLTGGKYSLRKVFWVERNHFWVALKNYPWPLLLALPWTTAWRYLLQLGLLLRGGTPLGEFVTGAGLGRTLGVIVWAAICAWARAPALLAQRCLQRTPTRVRGRALGRLLRQFRLSMQEIVTGRAACR